MMSDTDAKLADLEDRNQRNNMKLRGVPESISNSELTPYIQQLMNINFINHDINPKPMPQSSRVCPITHRHQIYPHNPHNTCLAITKNWKSPETPNLTEVNGIVSNICIYERALKRLKNSHQTFIKRLDPLPKTLQYL